LPDPVNIENPVTDIEKRIIIVRENRLFFFIFLFQELTDKNKFYGAIKKRN